MKKLLLLLFFLRACICISQTVAINTDLVFKTNLPSQKTERPPVIVMLHGYGSNEKDLVNIAQFIDPRFLSFSLRAPFHTNSDGYCWYSLDFLANKKFKHNYQQAQTSKAKILSFISSACKAYGADSSKVFILGFSQGAIMAYDIALSNPEKITGVVALSGFVMEESKKIKFDSFKLADVKFFVAHGTLDNVVDYKQGEQAAQYLQSKKHNVTFKSYNIAHTITPEELADIKSWLGATISEPKKK